MNYLTSRLGKAICFVIVSYICLILLAAAIFHAPWFILETLPQAKRDQLISTGVVSANSHPLYREWLMGFVRAPNEPRNPVYTMDSYLAYGEIVHASSDDLPSDFLGFANTLPPSQARILFVGDSFCNGASAGSRLSPPAVYSRLAGTPVYSGSNGGYGLNHYVRIIDKLTQGLPEDQRFKGRDVVVLTYLGNDFTSDMTLYSLRKQYSQGDLSWQLRLGPLRAWGKYLLSAYGARPALAAPAGAYAPVPMVCRTPGDLPVAWHPGYASYLIEENQEIEIPLALNFVDEMAALRARGLDIKIVLIPASPLLLAKDVDYSRVQPASRMAQELPLIARSLDRVRGIALEAFTRHGFEVLDLTPILAASPDRCLYYQPGDTHCTALGYEAIGRAIAAKWPDLGKGDASARAPR